MSLRSNVCPVEVRDAATTSRRQNKEMVSKFEIAIAYGKGRNLEI